jgi:hypothetical protein
VPTTATRQHDALGRVAEQERRRALEDDEHLLLGVLEVARAAHAGRQVPDVRPHGAQVAGQRREAAALVAALGRLQRALARQEDLEAHAGRLADGRLPVNRGCRQPVHGNIRLPS